MSYFLLFIWYFFNMDCRVDKVEERRVNVIFRWSMLSFIFRAKTRWSTFRKLNTYYVLCHTVLKRTPKALQLMSNYISLYCLLTIVANFSLYKYCMATQECCICLYKYLDGVELCVLPCNHHFHHGCISKWLRINATCPLCKFNILRGETLV